MRLKNNIALIVYSFGCALNALLLGHYFTLNQSLNKIDYSVYPGVTLYFNPNKKAELFEYLLGVTIIAVIFIFFVFWEKIASKKIRKYSVITISSLFSISQKNLLIFIFLFILPFVLYESTIEHKFLFYIQLYIVLIYLYIPFVYYFKKNLHPLLRSKGLKNSIYIILIIMSSGQLFLMFSGSIFNKPKIINEYYNIPEVSIVDNKAVDNKTYMLNHFQPRELSDKEFLLPNEITKQEIQFLANNQFETHWQILERYMIHHHNFMIAPINDYALGRNIYEINAQYGFGNIILLEKLFSFFDGVTLHSWLRLNYIFYYIYYALYIFFLYRFANNIKFTSFVFVGSVALLNMFDYEFIILAPGESPWRHLFDIAVMFALYKYQSLSKNRFIVIALTLSLFSVFINPQIGLMILCSSVFSVLFYLIYEKKTTVLVSILTIVTVALGIYLYKKYSGSNELARYYIDGVIGFPAPTESIFAFLVIIVFGYFLFYSILNKNSEIEYLPLLYIFLYAQCLLFYLVWHYDRNGILSRANIYFLTLSLFYYYAYKVKLVDKVLGRSIASVLFLVITIFYINSASKIARQVRNYDGIFKNHKIYTWNLEKAKIISTMNPQYFVESIELINKYSAKSNAIYLLSKYDNLLPFLSGKYSAMPFFDLKYYHITKNEVYKSINCINDKKPAYIYVDNDIIVRVKNNIIDSKLPIIGYLNTESIWRIQRLKLLEYVFLNVSNNYSLVASSPLISVYKLK